MGRYVEHVRVGPEDLLRAVAVVHVPVDDRDALEASRARVRGRDRHVVEQAEPHRLRGPGVVPRRAQERDALGDGAVDHRVDHRDERPCRQPGDLDALCRHVGVGVQVASLAAQLAERLDEAGVVHASELVIGRGAGLDAIEEGPGGRRPLRRRLARRSAARGAPGGGRGERAGRSAGRRRPGARRPSGPLAARLMAAACQRDRRGRQARPPMPDGAVSSCPGLPRAITHVHVAALSARMVAF